MVATRAQRAQTKDEPAAPKRGALKEPARRGKKKVGIEEPAPIPKPTRAAASKKATKPAATTAKAPAPATRRTRAKDAEALAPDDPEPAEEPEVEEKPTALPPTKPTRNAATRTAPKPAVTTTTTTTTTRKRSAREMEPEPARPAKRQTRSHGSAESDDLPQDESMDVSKPAAPKRATRATRATGGTKASQSRSTAAVKPLAQRITVTARKPTRKAREEVAESAVPEVEMEDAEETPAPASPKSTGKSSRKEASEEPQVTSAPESDAPTELTPAKSVRKPSKKQVAEEAPETPAQEAEMQEDNRAPATPVPSAKKTPQILAEMEVEKPEDSSNEHPAEQDTSTDQSAATPVRTPEAPQEQPKTPAKQTPAPPRPVRPEAKENVHPVKTPGLSHYTSALPFTQEATPFFRPEQPEKAFSLQASTPGFNKSLLHETPRKAPAGVSPFKLPPMSAAKLVNNETSAGSILNSPAKRGPLGTSMHGMTPMRPSVAKPEPKNSVLQTPARKGLMLPPATAPVNKQGFQQTQATSSLLQTCPRRIALPGLLPKSTMVSPSKTDGNNAGSSLLSATPRKVRIESPAKPAFPSDVQNFASQAHNSTLGAEPRRWVTPAKTPAKRFATPGRSPEKSLVDADAGSPTPMKKTPAGLKDVTSAIKFIHGHSPAIPPATPTEQFVLNVIDKLDQSMSESESTNEEALRSDSQDIEAARSVDESASLHDHDDIAADLELQQRDAGDMEQCVSPADLIMSDNETPVETPAAEVVEDAIMDDRRGDIAEESVALEATTGETAGDQSAQEASPREAIFEEPSTVEHIEATPARSEIQFIEEAHENVEEEQGPHFERLAVSGGDAVQPSSEEASAVEEQTILGNAHQERAEDTTTILDEFVQESVMETEQPAKKPEQSAQDTETVSVVEVPERPSTPTMEDQHIAALAKEKAKTERRARHKRLSLAIELENSIKKPRKSLAFIPSLTPAKSALRSPFKKPFGSPKKSVAWASEPAVPKVIEEFQEPATPKAETPKAVGQEIDDDFESNIPRPDEALLKDTVFFVDVRTAGGEDAGDLFIPLLEEMGAKIVSSWSGADNEITHVLFKDGSIDTLEKVSATHGLVKAVNIGWVLDCERFNKWVPEADYLVEISRLLGESPARALNTLSTANTPLRLSPVKSAYGTPFGVMHLTPKAKVTTLSPFADVTPKPITPAAAATTPQNKENTPAQILAFRTPTKVNTPAAAGEFSPSTPYFLHAQNIVQKTCPPKQQMKGLFERPSAEEAEPAAVTPFRQKMLLARRSLSPATFGRAQGL
ncbi:BRCT domain-containing protein [Macrophomina phaseolina MS6]|uniref:BRCT domain-containing protein n=1 Tax=Macrophomina phaseolina (strain MS6) TaxID=1126212 RepID=K2SF26_MACPH|nr:BRCT domain-containing protein [Macrophomina phaseolina MS6]